MAKRIFTAVFLSVLTAAIAVSALAAAIQYKIFDERLTEEIKTETGVIAAVLKDGGEDTFKNTAGKNRITLIAPDGKVLYDSAAPVGSMPNHSDREEFIEALETGEGESRRYSSTLSEETIYYALKTDNGSVLRISYTQSSVFGLMKKGLLPFVLFLTVMLVLTLYLSKYLASRIVAPINALNLDEPLENDTYAELSPLLTRMAKQKQDIADKIKLLSEKQTEFTMLTSNMSEGLLLTDSSGKVVSANEAAAEIFGFEKENIKNKHYLYACRDEIFTDLMRQAAEGKRSYAEYERGGKIYQLSANPIVTENTTAGTVLLASDVTEKHGAEKLRREFTANVSHELKTPLTSISGYAELMKEGVSDEADTKLFALRIYSEAQRLIALVADILRLSELDETQSLPQKTQVKLKALAQNVCERLKPIAEKYGVDIRVEGEDCKITAVASLIDEMIFNLAENALKYNRSGGHVNISLKEDNGQAVISVTDDGCGIAAKDLTHIFERFYRADKSRSRQSGGTGLGLAIVKHIASLHQAEIKASSTEGEGTSISVIFPKK